MIHFVPPQIEKMRLKVPELIDQVDVVLGNLEDAIPADAKEAARRGFIEMAAAYDFGATGLWTRINALNSPWALDDVVEIVGAVGRKLDVVMLPKVGDACAAAGIKPFYGPFGDFSDPEACEAQFRNAFLLGCAGAWTLHPSQIAIAKRVFSPAPAEVALARKILAAMPDGTGAVMVEGK